MLRPDEQLLLGHTGLDTQSRKTLQTALGNRAVVVGSESSNGLNATGATGAAVPVPYPPTSTSGSTLLSTVTGINAKVAANTTLYTPVNRVVVTSVILVPTLATAITAGPTIGIGTNATPSNIFASTALTTLTLTTQAYNFGAPGVLVIATNAAPVLLGVNAIATGTAMTLTAYCFGFLL